MTPPQSVAAAFGLDGEPVPLGGGRGSAWRIAHAVLKPLDLAPAELAWQADLLDAITCDGFRVSRPLRAGDGSLSVRGWSAWEWLEGEHEEARWVDVIAVGDRFHRAVRDVARSAFLDARTHQWAVGDRVAWGERPAGALARGKHVARLVAALKPVDAPSQLIHGDLTGNVLFAPGLPPAVIDLSAYWRPAAFASAVVVADALVWEGADDSLLDAVAHVERFEQYLLRALIFRLVAEQLAGPGAPPRPDHADPYRAAVELALGGRATGLRSLR